MKKFDKAWATLLEQHSKLEWFQIFDGELLDNGMAEILGCTVEQLLEMEGWEEWEAEMAEDL